MSWTTKLRAAALLLLGLASAVHGEAGSLAPGVAIFRSVGWAPGGAVRDGAAEMLMLMQVAHLRQSSGEAGVVAVGDRRGLFPAGAESALQAAVWRGVPVVKLASGGKVLPAPHGLFLDGGTLSETEAAAVLSRCLARYGPLPVARPAGPAGTVPAELRERLDRIQQEIFLAASVRLAAR